MKKLVIVGGPTASGKTSTAIEVAKHFDTEIVSADSRQFYREMNIGTAKPTEQELSKVKHHFINNLSINQSYNIGNYEQEALKIIENLHASNNIVVMTGGSFLYVRAVCEGLHIFPDVTEDVKEDLQHDWEQNGIIYLQEELMKNDPDYANQVDMNNPHRLIRALGVIRTTGNTFSSYQQSKLPKRPFHSNYFYLQWPREELYERINTRVNLMLTNGLVEEARELYSCRHLQALQTVGYQELFDYFEGEHDLPTAIELIKRNTRRYAKRQLTWLRNQANWQPIGGQNQANATAEIIRSIENT